MDWFRGVLGRPDTLKFPKFTTLYCTAGFMPLVGGAPGLRQPVHAEDLAIGALAAASSRADINKVYAVPGGETKTYREMIGRIFDGMRLPRRTISVPRHYGERASFW